MFIGEPKIPEELEAIALTAYINELTRRLDTRDLADEPDPLGRPRPASPPPEYDRNGKRTNTREQRKVHELEVERTLAVLEALHTIPGYVPPPTMTRLTKLSRKVFLPVRTYPHINFIGLLLGPRGNALRAMEAESGAKIGIRGRGSVKEGGRSATSNEDLHCVVTAESQAGLDRAEQLIEQVVQTAVMTPEHKNDFKRLQLRELAVLNGTLRDFENELCGFCRQPGHRKYDCPERKEIQRTSQCRRCGEMGHFEKDCTTSEDAQEAVQSFLDDIGDSTKAEKTKDTTSTDTTKTDTTKTDTTKDTKGEEPNEAKSEEIKDAPNAPKPEAPPLAPPPQFKLAPPKPFLPPPAKWGPK